MIFKQLRILFIFLLCIIATSLYAADGDVFTAKTIEGVDMVFRVVNENEKTCQVGADNYAIDTNYKGSITIPSNVNGYTVISIGKYAFGYCTGLSGVTIPNTVVSIKYLAFWSCTGLTELFIPSSVSNFGVTPFNGCSGLTHIVVDSNNEHFDSRFNCDAIIEKETNTLILGCKNTIIPYSVKTIGYGAFASNTGLTSIYIPISVTEIGGYAFNDCSNLSVAIIGASVTKICMQAFCSCSSLSNITIPESVTSIEDGAFSNCSSLEYVKSEIKEPFEINNVFFLLPSETELIVPYGKKFIYSHTQGWNVFSKITEVAPQ